MQPVFYAVAARLRRASCDQISTSNFKENATTVTATRISKTEVQVEKTVYTFSESEVADTFQRCVGRESIDTYTSNHSPSASRGSSEISIDDDSLPPGSVISPSMGGMP